MFKRGGGWRMEVQDGGGDPTGPCGPRSCFTGFPKDKTDILESGRRVGREEKGKGQALK